MAQVLVERAAKIREPRVVRGLEIEFARGDWDAESTSLTRRQAAARARALADEPAAQAVRSRLR